MCGRLFMSINPGQLRRIARCTAIRNPDRQRTCFNVGPTHYIPCIRKNNSERGVLRQNLSKTPNNNKQMVDDVQNKQQSQQDKEQIYQEEGCVASDLFIKQKNIFNQGETNDKEDFKENFNQQNLVEVDNDIQIEDENQAKDRFIDFMYWGYQTEFQNIINIRSEEAEMKKTFKNLVNKNRCVIITQGYYEWTPEKIPYVFHNTDKDYMLICAIYSEEPEQVMLLTRESFGKFDKVHHRMPVFIEEDEVEQWLNTDNDYNDVLFKQLLNRDRKVYDEMSCYRCSTNVNNVREQSIKCLMSFEEHKKELDKNGISKFFKKLKPQEEKMEVSNEKTYFNKQMDIYQTQQTNDLANKLNSIEVKDENKENIQKNSQNNQINNSNSSQSQSSGSGEDKKLQNNKLMDNTQRKPETSKQKNVINSLKKEVKVQQVQQQQQQQQQYIQNSQKKSQKVVKSTTNAFQEGLEQFFLKKNQNDSK